MLQQHFIRRRRLKGEGDIKDEGGITFELKPYLEKESLLSIIVQKKLAGNGNRFLPLKAQNEDAKTNKRISVLDVSTYVLV